MCELLSVEQGVAGMKGKIILWIVGIAFIVLGIMLAVFGYTSSAEIGMGILVIVTIFCPYKWVIIWAMICEIICAITVAIDLIGAILLLDKYQVNVAFFIIVIGFIFIFIFTIFSIIVYVKALKGGSSGGSRSSTGTFSS